MQLISESAQFAIPTMKLVRGTYMCFGHPCSRAGDDVSPLGVSRSLFPATASDSSSVRDRVLAQRGNSHTCDLWLTASSLRTVGDQCGVANTALELYYGRNPRWGLGSMVSRSGWSRRYERDEARGHARWPRYSPLKSSTDHWRTIRHVDGGRSMRIQSGPGMLEWVWRS